MSNLDKKDWVQLCHQKNYLIQRSHGPKFPSLHHSVEFSVNIYKSEWMFKNIRIHDLLFYGIDQNHWKYCSVKYFIGE